MDRAFCSKCGHELSAKVIDGHIRLMCANCGYIQFENPKVSVGVLIENAGQVLLAKRTIDPFAGYWYLPSGYMEIDETPEEAAKREAREEICVEVAIGEVFDVLSYNDDPRSSGVIIIFRAQIERGEPQPGDEVSDTHYFAPEDLPRELAFGHHRKVLNKWLGDLKERNLIDLDEASEDYRYRDQLMIQEFSIGLTALAVLVGAIINQGHANFGTFEVLALLLAGWIPLGLLAIHLNRINNDRINCLKFIQQLEENLHLHRIQTTHEGILGRRSRSVPLWMVRFFRALFVVWTFFIVLWVSAWVLSVLKIDVLRILR
jgi:8-oxo-dGTP diphosphatase